MPDFPTLPDELATTFARRVAERDIVRPPEPLSQTPAAIAERLERWLQTTHGVRDSRSRPRLAQMLLLLLAQSEASTAALQQIADLGPRMAASALQRLAGWGLTSWKQRSHTRYHYLTRAGEDALLVVVMGAPAPPAATEQASVS